MKLSLKLLLGMISTFLVLIVINAFSLKSKWEKIDKNNLYSDFKKLSNKPFKYLKVSTVDGMIGKVNISKGQNFQIHVSPFWSERVRAKILKDTLYVEFINNSNGKSPAFDEYEKVVVVECPELDKIETNNVTVVIDSLNQKSMSLLGKGYGSFESKSLTLNDLKLVLKDNSSCNFHPQKQLKLISFDADLSAKSYLNMRAVLPQKIKLVNGIETGLEMNGATLKLLEK
jgi:hypothetical protein